MQGKKWARMQSVTMPPNVTCPIHTSRGQIPNTKERALRYTPAADLAELMDGKVRNGGVRLTLDPGKVSESTAVGFGISLTSAGLGRAIDVNSKIKGYVNIENHFAKYSLNAVSQFNTLSFTGIGALAGMANDTNNKEAAQSLERFARNLDSYLSGDKFDKEWMKSSMKEKID